MEEPPDKIQHTKEPKLDTLKKITYAKGIFFMLPIAFQVKNDEEMTHRMPDYKAILFRKHCILIRQQVIYLGNGQMTMERIIQMIDLIYKYNLITINIIRYKKNPQIESTRKSYFASFS